MDQNVPIGDNDPAYRNRTYYVVEGAKGKRPRTTGSWSIRIRENPEMEKEQFVRRWAKKNGYPETAEFAYLLAKLEEEAEQSRKTRKKTLFRRIRRFGAGR